MRIIKDTKLPWYNGVSDTRLLICILGALLCLSIIIQNSAEVFSAFTLNKIPSVRSLLKVHRNLKKWISSSFVVFDGYVVPNRKIWNNWNLFSFSSFSHMGHMYKKSAYVDIPTVIIYFPRFTHHWSTCADKYKK